MSAALKFWQLPISDESVQKAGAVDDLNSQLQELAEKVAKLEQIIK